MNGFGWPGHLNRNLRPPRLEDIKAGVDNCNHFLKYCLFLFCDSGFLVFLSYV